MLEITMANPYFYAGGRRRKLFRQKLGGNFHVRFQHKGKDIDHSTRTTIETIAKERARAKIEETINGDALAARRPRSFSTIPELLAAYDPRPDEVSPITARDNRAKLRLLIKEGLGVDPDKATAAVLASADVIKNFQRKRMLAVKDADFEIQERTKISTNSIVTQAKSVVSKKWAEMFKSIVLPDLIAFREAAKLPVKIDLSFVPFAPGVIERIDEEIPLQPRNRRIAAILMRYCGLRNSEVEHAKWEWFTLNGDGTATLSIELRPYFKVKNESVRTLILDVDLVERLVPFWGSPDEWVIDAPHETARYDAAHDELNNWLRSIIPDRTKCAYELRKHAGSEILTRPESEGGGLAAAARFLGDSIQTTEKHYVRFLKPVHAVRSKDSALREPLAVVRSAA